MEVAGPDPLPLQQSETVRMSKRRHALKRFDATVLWLHTRQVVNTTAPDGRTVGVMAQQYVVLVEGVPDPAAQAQCASLGWISAAFCWMFEF